MKKLFFSLLVCLMALTMNAQRIAVLDFNAGSGISQSDVDGISAIFNTYFSPQGYTLVERTRVDRIMDEQGFQRGRFTQDQMVRIGQLLNVSRVVVGDINYAFKQYNVDVRVVNVESATIAAKSGVTWEQGASYREMMKSLAEDLARQVSIIPVETKPEEQITYSTNGERLGIGIYDGKYVYNGQFISKRDCYKMVKNDCFIMRDYATQVRIKKCAALIWSGFGSMIAGSALFLGGLIAFGTSDDHGVQEEIGGTMIGIGGGLMVCAVPLLSVGYVRRTNAINDYLNAPTKPQPTAEFRLQASENGLGFAVVF